MNFLNWVNDWNDIIRDVIYPDVELKTLMEVPADASIIEFIDRYFIRAGFANTLLKDENVRVVYSDLESQNTDVPNVKHAHMCFDIYVRTTELHNVGRDRLLLRTRLIANRLIELLTQERYMKGYRFWVDGDYDLGTRTAGYTRYNLTMSYMKVY